MKKLKIVIGGGLILSGLFECIDIISKTKQMDHPHPMQDVIEDIAIIIVGILLLRWGLKNKRIEF
jgi:hypothetical protein